MLLPSAFFLGLLWPAPTCGNAALPVQPPPCENLKIDLAEECPGSLSDGLAWVAYAEELYAARASGFAGGLAEAVAQVHALLERATSPFSGAFACLPALMSTYFSLAHLLALQGRARRALAMLQMGFLFVRDRGFSECTPWPVSGFDMMVGGKVLTARVRRLDDESVDRAVAKGHRESGLRVAIVTICAYAPDEPVRVINEDNKRLYAALHGYDLHFFTDKADIASHASAGMDVKDGSHKAFFWKVNAVRNVMDSGKYDWVLWMDCDAFFMDPLRTIDSIIMMHARNATPSSLLPPKSSDEAQATVLLREQIRPTEVSLIFAVDSTGINNGVWLLKNTAWSLEFLSRWWHSDILSGPGQNHNCSDQSTMVHALLHDRAMRFDAAYDAVEGPVWPPEARVAAQEYLQSFHEGTAESAMSRAWQEGDFIKHHPGCHYYKPPCQYMYAQAQEHFARKVALLQAAAS